jgi:hypothetical protein
MLLKPLPNDLPEVVFVIIMTHNITTFRFNIGASRLRCVVAVIIIVAAYYCVTIIIIYHGRHIVKVEANYYCLYHEATYFIF